MFSDIVRNLLVKLHLIPQPVFITQVVQEHPVPEEIKKGRLYLVRGGKKDKWACFRCPGGCDETIKLSLSQSRSPRWSVSSDWLKRPTVLPSVRQISECRCHFWVKKGGIDWCADTGQRQK